MDSGKLEEVGVLDDILQKTVHDSGLYANVSQQSFVRISGVTFKETTFSKAAVNFRAITFST
jgi:hypothetical protein